MDSSIFSRCDSNQSLKISKAELLSCIYRDNRFSSQEKQKLFDLVDINIKNVDLKGDELDQQELQILVDHYLGENF